MFGVLQDAKLGKYICVEGGETYLVRLDDDGVGREVFSTFGFDFDKFEQAMEILKRSRGVNFLDLLVDVGANIGTIAIPAVRRGFANCAVAIEPEKTNFALLSCNLILNEVVSRVSAVRCAVGNAVADVELETNPKNSGDHRIRVSINLDSSGDINRTFESVPMKSLGDILDMSGATVTSQSLVWMDIQGFEVAALEGFKKRLAECPALVMEFWPEGIMRAGANFQALLDCVAHYSTFFDLNCPKVGRNISDLQTIWNEFASGSRQTDLMFF